MEEIIQEKYWHRFFELGITLKTINGLWETITGFLLIYKVSFFSWIYIVNQNELVENPSDKFFSFLSHIFLNFSADAKKFIAIYLLIHGILNIFLAIQLYRQKHWAYLAMMGTALIFVIYQIYRISIYHSLFLTFLTIFDVIFIILIWHEYKHHESLKIKEELL